jgi:hypothetical protein
MRVSQAGCLPGTFEPDHHFYSSDEIASMSAAFKAATSMLGLVDRKDSMTMTVAKLIMELAKKGERIPRNCARPL